MYDGYSKLAGLPFVSVKVRELFGTIDVANFNSFFFRTSYILLERTPC